jgi:ATP-dependent Lhr-like helicase
MPAIDAQGASSTPPALAGFHPAVALWFSRRFPEGPTEAQALGWPHVRDGADTLIAAPTGSGKTLAGFLVAIDASYRAHEAGEELAGATRLVYVSPLKALAVDIHQNLERPLAEIAEVARELGYEVPPISVAVRTGDTTQSARTAMVKAPPTFLATTPESLYLLVTAQRSRAALGAVRSVLVDEIHALARDKRGTHLALTLERLDHLQEDARPQRIGLSATQRPIEMTARLLTGARRAPARIVDCGHRRALSVRVELPGSELSAVASTEQLEEVVDRIAEHVADHQTTLVFVNTRRLSERLAHMLGERLGADQVAAHHGSLSADRRQRTESRLRAGELRALVATASLELGIDIGPVELVCQVGSPRSIATFLQRVGRSNHSRLGVPEGILYPLTRDELVECAALMAAVHAGRLDSTLPPEQPLDILAQQLVAEVAAAGEWAEDDLFALARGAAPFASLAREDFDAVLELAAEGIQTGRGARMAYLHRDRVNGLVRPRRGARLAALTSGGAIAEIGDYRVVAEPEDTTVGSVNEDFAIESMAGDVFLLGTHSWQVKRVTAGEVRVVDAHGANPTIPFWVGEAPARTDELSEEVSELRCGVGEILAGGAGVAPPGAEEGRTATLDAACAHVQEHCQLDAAAARQVVEYLSAAREQLGVLPSRREIVFERFFDEAGGMQLVVHAPLGARVNRAYGLALRKRFCVNFDFELQAAASDDALVLSLGPQHSFPLESAPALVRSQNARGALEQAVLESPMFTSRWRWNLNRALAVLRFRGGRKSPIQIQRMEAEDVMAAVFPALAACQENAPPGPIEIPDQVLVRQTLYDTLHEAMDVDGLLRTLSQLEAGEIRAHFVDSTEPSLLAHEILNGKPYTFLDDAPLEERRTRAVQMRRGLPLEGRELARLDAAAIERVRAEAAPDLRGPDELHDLLLATIVHRPLAGCEEWFGELVASGRAMSAGGELWCATERRPWVRALFPDATFAPDRQLVRSSPDEQPEPDDAAACALRGHLDLSGPVTVAQLAAATALAPSRVEVGLARLEAEGFAMRGRFDPQLEASDGEAEQWCARRLLARIHAYTQSRLRREIEPVSTQELMRFLLHWQHAAPGAKRHGRAGVLAVIDQLQGFELAAGAWEEAVFPARIESYQERWLEDLCLAGEVVWGRFAVRSPEPGESPARRGAATPSRATPITFALREDLPWLLRAARGDAAPEEPAHGASRELLEALRARGAMFQSELRAATGRLPAEVEEGLWDLVARGLVTADGFAAVRALFSARETFQRRRRVQQRRRVGARRAPSLGHGGEGRWALLPGVHVLADEQRGVFDDPQELAEQLAGQLLARWGVVFYDLVSTETLAVPWRELLWALRRLEARGLVRGGRFVAGFSGEQFALPEAVDALRRQRRARGNGEHVRLSAADPLNLSGVVLPGARVPARRKLAITYRDGVIVDEPSEATTRERAAMALGG